MTPRGNWRLVDLEFKNPYFNMAVEEAIPLAVGKGLAPNTLRFWRNENTVVIGRFQCPALEINFKECLKMNVSVIRRFTGGGAVYHDYGNLNYALSLRRELMEINDLFEGFKLIGTAVADGLKRKFGINAKYIPINDIQVEGKKISGMAGSVTKDFFFVHGCILVSSNLNVLVSVLNVPKEKLADKKVQSVRKRVTTIKEMLKREVRADEVKEAIKQGLERAFGVRFIKGGLTKEEEELARKLYDEKYSKMEWSLGPCKFCIRRERDEFIFRYLTFRGLSDVKAL